MQGATVKGCANRAENFENKALLNLGLPVAAP